MSFFIFSRGKGFFFFGGRRLVEECFSLILSFGVGIGVILASGSDLGLAVLWRGVGEEKKTWN